MNSSKVALITGSSRGIGKEIALHLSDQNYAIVLNYKANKAEAEQVLDTILREGKKAICVKADVGDPESVKTLRKVIEEEYGRLDVLINNAGIIVRPGSWNEISNEDILTTINTNLLGPIYTIREFVPLMMELSEANIINITSTYSYNGAAAVLAYTSSKAGVNSLTKAMALELSKFNIRVNAIAAGNFDTEMTKSGGQDLIDWIISTVPLKRLGEPTEISNCIDFLLKSKYITGHIVNIDGGQLLNI